MPGAVTFTGPGSGVIFDGAGALRAKRRSRSTVSCRCADRSDRWCKTNEAVVTVRMRDMDRAAAKPKAAIAGSIRFQGRR